MKAAYLIYKALKFNGAVAVGDMGAPFVCVGAVVLDPERSDGAVRTEGGRYQDRADGAVYAALNGDRAAVDEVAPVVNPLAGEIWYGLGVPPKFDGAPCTDIAAFLFTKFNRHRIDDGEPKL